MRLRQAIGWCLLLGAFTAASACGDDSGASAPNTTIVDDEAGESLPEWLSEVYPPPGANAAADAVVEVSYNVLPPRHEVRLVVDGIDVTTQAGVGDRGSRPGVFPSPGHLRYEPGELEIPLVRLDPGEHDAAVRLVKLPEAGETLISVDDFAWSFETQ